MAHLESSNLFSVKGLVAVITGGGSGKDQIPSCRLLSLRIPFISFSLCLLWTEPFININSHFQC